MNGSTYADAVIFGPIRELLERMERMTNGAGMPARDTQEAFLHRSLETTGGQPSQFAREIKEAFKNR